MFLDPERDKDAEARFYRFEKSFKAEARMWDLVNEILDKAAMKLRDGKERNLSLFVGASLGKRSAR